VSHLTELIVEVYNWLGAIIECLKSLSKGLSIVILPLDGCLRGTDQASFHEGVFVHIIEEYALALADILLEIDGLFNGTRETVNQIVLGWVGNQAVDQDLHGQFEGHETALSHDLADLLSILGALNSKS
jgi:hypothetical protein